MLTITGFTQQRLLLVLTVLCEHAKAERSHSRTYVCVRVCVHGDVRERAASDPIRQND